MINWFKKLFEGGEEYKFFIGPNFTTIYEFIKNNIDEEGLLKKNAKELPDEIAEKDDDIKALLTPGLMDVLIGQTSPPDETIELVNEIASLFESIAKTGNIEIQKKLYRVIIENESIISYIDLLLEKMTELEISIEPHLYNYAKRLLYGGHHRNAVKLGIAILGVCNKQETLPAIKLVGLHEEFTLFSTIAIINLSENPEMDLWSVAKKVEGWGRIQLIERLSEFVTQEKVKSWLLRQGYRNTVMYEYLSYTCATVGELHLALEKNIIDDALFVAAGEILNGLLNEGGPAEDIYDYSFASPAIEYYVNHSKEHAYRLSDFLVLDAIQNYLKKEDSEIQRYDDNPRQDKWDKRIKTDVLLDTISLLRKKDWTTKVISELTSEDASIYWNAKEVAKILKMDLWDTFWKRLNNNPKEVSYWYDIMQEATDETIDLILAFAEKHIPLEDIATGPAEVLGFGKAYIWHRCLEEVVDALEKFPTKGVQFLITALNSPVSRNRIMAIKTVTINGLESYPNNLKLTIKKLSKIDPKEEIRENLESLLSK